MDHLEIEFKSMLTEEEYKNLLPFFQTSKAITQTNYYIDSTGYNLRQAKIVLRVRTFSDTLAELTLKIPQKLGNMEYNQTLKPTEISNLLEKQIFPEGKIAQLLEGLSFSTNDLRIIGHLETIRMEKQIEIGLLALDESHYFGKTDFELELEVRDFKDGQKQFQSFLKEHHIEYKAGKSKIGRFSENI